MQYVRLEFTPLEFETMTTAKALEALEANQNLLRWSLKPAIFGVYVLPS